MTLCHVRAEWTSTFYNVKTSHFFLVIWPSRLVIGKKFFWIWFIYTLEGCVLVLHFFILTKCHLWNTLVCTVWTVSIVYTSAADVLRCYVPTSFFVDSLDNCAIPTLGPDLMYLYICTCSWQCNPVFVTWKRANIIFHILQKYSNLFYAFLY